MDSNQVSSSSGISTLLFPPQNLYILQRLKNKILLIPVTEVGTFEKLQLVLYGTFLKDHPITLQ